MFFLRAILWLFRATLSAKTDLVMENLALRQQLIILRRKAGQPRLRRQERVFWLWLCRSWNRWRESLLVVTPETVLRWHKQGFKYYGTWKCRRRGGRPAVPHDLRQLIRRMSRANPLWGAPRVHGELRKLGIDISQSAVGKYIFHHRKPPERMAGSSRFLRSVACTTATPVWQRSLQTFLP